MGCKEKKDRKLAEGFVRDLVLAEGRYPSTRGGRPEARLPFFEAKVDKSVVLTLRTPPEPNLRENFDTGDSGNTGASN